MEEVRYERLRPGQIVKRSQACPVAYLPPRYHRVARTPEPPRAGWSQGPRSGHPRRATRWWPGLSCPLVRFPSRVPSAGVQHAQSGGSCSGAGAALWELQSRLHGGRDGRFPGILLSATTLSHLPRDQELRFRSHLRALGPRPTQPYAVLTCQLFERQTGVKMEAAWAAELVEGYREITPAVSRQGS